ncbi:MAG: nucleotidyltransferase family protein [Polyangiaceae bacterium]|nr:nucleotidyltransferase family protein [Polyangiaceae bacterium]
MARRLAEQSVSDDQAGLTRPKHLPLREAPDEPYEHRLNEDLGWALKQGSLHFEEKSAVHESLRRIARRLDELGIPYAIAGGMALFMHGYQRMTVDVDILVSKEDIKRIHEALEGRGYLPPFERSKNLRDTENKVRIEFLLSGGYPGDGKPKPVVFPEPSQVSIDLDGIRVLQLPTLVELKLASGMTSPDRLKDLTDVQELIKLLGLSSDFAHQLNPYVREKYQELWSSVRGAVRRYILLWRNKWLTADAKTLPEMIASLKEAAERLEAMLTDGVVLDPKGGTEDDYAYLVTTDPDVARKYDMHDESEMMPEEE